MPNSLVDPRYQFDDKHVVVSNAATPPKLSEAIPGHRKIIIEYIDAAGCYVIEQFHIMPRYFLSNADKRLANLFGQRLYCVFIEKPIQLDETEYESWLKPDPSITKESNKFKHYGLENYFSRTAKSSDQFSKDDNRFLKMKSDLETEERKNQLYLNKYEDIFLSLRTDVINFFKTYLNDLTNDDPRKQRLLNLTGDHADKFCFSMGCEILNAPYSPDYLAAIGNEDRKKTADLYQIQRKEFNQWENGLENAGYQPLYLMARYDPSDFQIHGHNCGSWANLFVKSLGLDSSFPDSSPMDPWVQMFFKTKDRTKWLIFGSAAVSAISLFAYRKNLTSLKNTMTRLIKNH
jgi:hypothetical protein